MSIEELAKTIPVNPPIENRNTNPMAHIRVGESSKFLLCKVAIHLKILTPVGIAIIIVAVVK
jgi:hypothetical protein